MKFVENDSLTDNQKSDILVLWNQEYPKDLSLPDVQSFEKYLAGLEDRHHLLLLDEKDRVKGWLIYFFREDERCFAMLLDPGEQGKGLGSRLLNLAKERNTELHGWVIDNSEELKENGQKYRSPIPFYEKNGFEILREVSSAKNNINGIKVRWKASAGTSNFNR